MADLWTASLRVSRSFNLGGLLGPGPFSGPMGSNASNAPASAMAQGPGGGGGERVMVMAGDPGQARDRFDLYASLTNLFNRRPVDSICVMC